MKLKLIKALWGMTGALEEQFQLISNAGYTGIEAPMPNVDQEAQFKELLAQYGFEYIAMVFTGGEDHVQSFESQVRRAKDFNPILITAHSAKDSMGFDEQLAFFDKAIAIEKEAGIPVGHETHRGRAMFTPWTTAALLKALPDLKITADFSHWVCVCERLLEDESDHLKIAISRAIHVHTRVGYAEGPQVADPRAPEYQGELEVHEGWWDKIYEAKASQGASFLTMTPEFGPPGYMHTLPFTNQPVSSLWDICLWMKRRLEERYHG